MNRHVHARLLDQGEVRTFAPQDALGVADLFVRAHGWSYAGRAGPVADPDAIAARAERRGPWPCPEGASQGEGRAAGGGTALVVALPDGRIVGYAALTTRRPGTVELSEVLADHALCPGALAARLAEAAGVAAGRLGARKLVHAAPTFHAGGQRLVGPLGLVPCHLAVGEHPASLGFRGIAAGRATQRESFLVGAALRERARLRVHLPARHAPAIRRIYEALRVGRDEAPEGPEAPPPPLPPRGEVEVELRERWQSGRIRIVAPGDDTLAIVAAAVEDWREGFVEHVEARVPLDGPVGPVLVEALEAAGFFFSGIDPDEGGRDELILTRLLGARVDPGRIAVEGDPARALLAYVAASLPVASLDTAVLPAPAASPPPASPVRPASRTPAAVPPPPLEMIEFARLAGQKQLIAGLAHEINNPLNVILGSTYYLKGRAREGRTDEVLPRLATIEAEVARVAKVLENVRRFAHPEATPRGRLDVARPIDDALALVAGEIRAAGIEVRRAIPDDLPPVRGNTAELEQVFFQLLRNALEASGPGGEIALEARAEGATVVAAVRDRGRGISLEDQRRVFEPFFTTKDRGAGAGLGLPIARAIVESHDGRLRLESRSGEGTAAVVELPVAREREGAERAARGEGAVRA